MHAFQRKSIKNDCHKFISIINVKLASWMRNVNGLYTRRRSCCAYVKIPSVKKIAEKLIHVFAYFILKY